MHPSPPTRRRIPRLIAGVVLLTAVVGSLVTIGAPPAGAVPVDGLYSGTIANTVGGSSASMSVTLSTSAPNRSPVTASVNLGAGVTVQCLGTQSIPATTGLVFTGTGGTPSASPSGVAVLSLTGSTSVSGITIPISISATVSRDRGRLAGTVTLDLPGGFPFNCSDAVLSFDTRSDTPYKIRTGHDGGPDVNGVDITHMIDREPAGTPTPWERCMFLWATPPAGTTVTSATWSIAAGAPPGAHIKAGWSNGAPAGTPDDGTPFPLRTQVCITDATPVDSTFTVEIAPNGGGVDGRVLLWVGNFVNFAGRAQGDVHNTTFDEMHYDFQGVGEYVDAVDGSGKEFAVQSRLEVVPSSTVTVTTAIAAQVNGDRVGLYLDASGVAEWYLNGKPLTVPATLPSGGEITNPTSDHWRVTWPKGTATEETTMQVSLARWTPMDHLNIDEIVLGPALQYGQVRGLLGVADRNPTNDLTPSTGGNPVSADIDPSIPPYTQPLYKDFGRSWLVTTSGGPLDTLFDYLDPKHPDPGSYENEAFPAERPGVVDPKAAAICQRAGVTAFPQIDFCTYDVEVTGAREITKYYSEGWLPV
jgi:hypothetical protein